MDPQRSGERPPSVTSHHVTAPTPPQDQTTPQLDPKIPNLAQQQLGAPASSPPPIKANRVTTALSQKLNQAKAKVSSIFSSIFGGISAFFSGVIEKAKSFATKGEEKSASAATKFKGGGN